MGYFRENSIHCCSVEYSSGGPLAEAIYGIVSLGFLAQPIESHQDSYEWSLIKGKLSAARSSSGAITKILIH